jgi:putative transposase
MGLEAVYAKPWLRAPGKGHRFYSYEVRGVAIERPDQVWCADITYVPVASGFMYLVAFQHAGRLVLPGHAGGRPKGVRNK